MISQTRWTLNRYNYVKSSPLNYIDPSGNQAISSYAPTIRLMIVEIIQFRRMQHHMTVMGGSAETDKQCWIQDRGRERSKSGDR